MIRLVVKGAAMLGFSLLCAALGRFRSVPPPGPVDIGALLPFPVFESPLYVPEDW